MPLGGMGGLFVALCGPVSLVADFLPEAVCDCSTNIAVGRERGGGGLVQLLWEGGRGLAVRTAVI
jgi:hypothetical protein